MVEDVLDTGAARGVALAMGVAGSTRAQACKVVPLILRFTAIVRITRVPYRRHPDVSLRGKDAAF